MPGVVINHADPLSVFAERVGAATGIDPRVIVAWAKSEGEPGASHNNFLNLAYNDPRTNMYASGVGPANTAYFPNLSAGILATITRLKEPFASGIVRAARAPGATPESEIQAIASSGWAESHYGSPPGVNLENVFGGLFGRTALSQPAKHAGGGGGGDILGGVGGAIGGAAGAVGGAVGGAAGAVAGAIEAPYDWGQAVVKAISFIFSFRFLEILGGGLLLLVGLYLLGRKLGAPTPTLPVIRQAAETVPSA